MAVAGAGINQRATAARQALDIERVGDTVSIALLRHEATLSHQPEVLGDRGRSHAELVGEIRYAHTPVLPEQLDDAQACRRAKDAKEIGWVVLRRHRSILATSDVAYA